jgi:2-polyprenyl-6-methoxyphenol hydroxylase-like FAD-dependent oxidoreductase
VVTLRKVANGAESTVRAKYVVGCDGARSRVRDSIGAVPRGDFANHAWGVVDMLAVTDFPDIRLKAAIQSADEGNILLIPREGGYMVRSTSTSARSTRTNAKPSARTRRRWSSGPRNVCCAPIRST